VPRLLLSPRAQLDLEEIGDYIARDNPARAISFLDELKGIASAFRRCRLPILLATI
jgi:toxin ParE1/3/4